ncbi:restriction endonuclease subunit S [Leptotrichia sp. oral taxon 847]|uniref:restriction endonuclease subunit S n=1 Tax=Leptotrichia sp. oral taxon 847 TaxID=1785996 RepID=UPI0009EA055D|nr:restriction endonuclease subunit S [Leptotrichia sp. oral taxon 847]
MNFIDELLKDEKVEWKKLGEVFNTRTGYTPSKKKLFYWENGTVDWFTIEDIRQRGRNLNFANIKISEYGVKKEVFKSNSIVLSIIGTIGEYALIKTNFVINQQFMVFTLKESYSDFINMEFMKYYFSKISNYCIWNRRKSSVPTVDTDKILRIKIPILSLKIQEKIVKILDNFTKYVTELQARNKQYNYYRDMLLSEDYLNKISEKLVSLNNENYVLHLTTLGEVGKVSMCRRILKNQTTSNGEVPFYKIGTFGKKADSFISKSLFEEYKSRYSFPKKGDILISASGTIGRTVIYNGEDAYFQDSNIVWIDNDETVVKNKYLYYFYSTNPWKISNGGTISRIYNKDIEKIKIFVSPIEIQNKIVKILDRFQGLLSDTKGLLPLEIEQRRKQYEYYREKLLTFDSICDRTKIFKQYLRLVNEAAKVAGIDISDKVEWKRLGEVANVNRGASPRPIKNYLTDDITGVPWIKIGDAKKESKYIENTSEKITREGSLKSRILKKGDLILSNSLWASIYP